MVLSGTNSGGVMARYLRTSKQSKSAEKGLYLQIYESNHVPGLGSRSQLVKTIGYVKDEEAKGIKDPVEYYRKSIKKFNENEKKRKESEKAERISDSIPIKNVGYFLAKAVLNKLDIRNDINCYDIIRNCQFNHYDMLEALVCSKIMAPGPICKTAEEVIPSFYEKYSLTRNQIYDEYPFLGSEYEAIIQIFNRAVKEKYGRKTDKVYFDCTNYYFEIDYESGDKQKGPSKENQNSPIIGMALMLDSDKIPLGMKMFPGNESEKPEMRKMAAELKKKGEIKGKTIFVADKGLNCISNISQILLDKNGYIFSKSVKQLSDAEKEWLLEQKDFTEHIEDGEVKYKYYEFEDDFKYRVKNSVGKITEVELPEKRVLTYNPSLAKKQIAEINKLVSKAKELSASKSKKSEYGEASKYVQFKSIDKKTGELTDDIIAQINIDKVNMDINLAGYNLLVTSEKEMNATEIYSVYHNLWKIEESFRYLKTFLEARPVYVSNSDSIYGHFLICYLSLLIIRLMEIKEFKNKICDSKITEFIRKFNVLVDKKKIINCTAMSIAKHVDDLIPKQDLTKKYYTDKEILNILNFGF